MNCFIDKIVPRIDCTAQFFGLDKRPHLATAVAIALSILMVYAVLMKAPMGAITQNRGIRVFIASVSGLTASTAAVLAIAGILLRDIKRSKEVEEKDHSYLWKDGGDK